MRFLATFQMVKITLAMALAGLTAMGAGYDGSLQDFPRLKGETDDAPRLQRAVDSLPSGVLHVPGGVYELASTLKVKNLCSLDLHKSAVLRAVTNLDYVVKVDNGLHWKLKPGDVRREDYNIFISGGTIDGNGLASCLALDNFCHYTLRDTTYLNGLKAGLRVAGEGGGYEVVAYNLYFKCVKSGMAGNAAVWASTGDSQYTDCIVVDYTVGFRMSKGGSSVLTRCHVWGGPLPPVKPGEDREMLKDSICFWVDGACDTLIRDCYADTGKTGFKIDGYDTRICGSRFYNNWGFKLDDVTIVDHLNGKLLVSECRFSKQAPHTRVYRGAGTVEWRNMTYSGFNDDEPQPGALDYEIDQDVDTADDWELLPVGSRFKLDASQGFGEQPDYLSRGAEVSRRKFLRRFPKSGPGKEVVIRARALEGATDKVEFTLRENSGRVWGYNVELTPQWREIRIPLEKFRYFQHLTNTKLEEGWRPDARCLKRITFTFGKWLYPKTFTAPHGFEVESVKIRGR